MYSVITHTSWVLKYRLGLDAIGQNFNWVEKILGRYIELKKQKIDIRF